MPGLLNHSTCSYEIYKLFLAGGLHSMCMYAMYIGNDFLERVGA